MKDAELTLTCPVPSQKLEKILLGHGSGGKLTAQLIDEVFIPVFGKSSGHQHDGAFLNISGRQLAFTTDTFVVKPLFFPGGDIGRLAVNGTVNDLSMCGATPLYLSCGFVIEEGFKIGQLNRVVQSMQEAAENTGIRIVTGDTKVVEKGKADGLYLNTSGIGLIEYRPIMPGKIKSGDIIIVNGDIGRHGMAVMSVREGLEFESAIVSDTKSLYPEVRCLLENEINVHCLRDLTRGGLATALVEISEACGLNIEIDETAVPLESIVKGACELLGLDPLYVACEGRMAVFVDASSADEALKLMQSFNPQAAVIGRLTSTFKPKVIAKTFLGTKRILDRLAGDQLPRIC